MPGKTFNLNNSQNSAGETDDITGTPRVDTFRGASDESFDSADTLDGAGSIDKLIANYTIERAPDGTNGPNSGDDSIAGITESIEQVFVDASLTQNNAEGDAEDDFAFDVTDMDGVNQLWNDGSSNTSNNDGSSDNDTAIFDNVSQDTTVGLRDTGFATQVNFSDTSGRGDTASFVADGISGTSAPQSGDSGDQQEFALTANGIETFDIETTGDASTINGVKGDSVETVNISGDADVTLSGLADNITTVDAGGGDATEARVTETAIAISKSGSKIQDGETVSLDIGGETATATLAGEADFQTDTVSFAIRDKTVTLTVAPEPDGSGVNAAVDVGGNTTAETFPVDLDAGRIAAPLAAAIAELPNVEQASADGATVTVTAAADADVAATNFTDNTSADLSSNVTVVSEASLPVLAGDLDITAGSTDVDLTGGTGDDVFRFGPNLSSADTVDGGGGQDALLSSSGAVGGSTFDNVSNVEILSVSDRSDATVNVSTLGDAFETVNFALTDTNNTSQKRDVTANGLDSDNSVNVTSANLANGNSNTANQLNALGTVELNLSNASGSSDSLTLNIDNNNTTPRVDSNVSAFSDVTGEFAVSQVDAAGVETFTIDSTGSLGPNQIGQLNVDDATTINIAGDQQVTIDDVNTANLSAGDAVTFDASGAAGTLAVTFDGNRDHDVTATSSDDRVTFSSHFDDDDAVDGGNGVDSVTAERIDGDIGDAALSNVERATFQLAGGGANADTISLGQTAGLASVELDINDALQAKATLEGVSAGTSVGITNAGNAGEGGPNSAPSNSIDSSNILIAGDSGVTSLDVLLGADGADGRAVAATFAARNNNGVDGNDGDAGEGLNLDSNELVIDGSIEHTTLTVEGEGGDGSSQANGGTTNTNDDGGDGDDVATTLHQLTGSGLTAATLNLSNSADFTLDNLEADSLETLTLVGGSSADDVDTVTIDDQGAGATASLTKLDASGLDARLQLGSPGTAVEFANGASVTGTDKNDTVYANIDGPGTVALDAGDQESSGGDNLKLTGTQTDQIIIDLSQTDQMPVVNGNPESAVQTGFENVDASAVTPNGPPLSVEITASDAANRITGSSARDRIDGGAGDDTLTGLAGRDELVGGGGADTFRLTAVGDSQVADGDLSNLDTIKDLSFDDGDTLDLEFVSSDANVDILNSVSTFLSNSNILTDLNTGFTGSTNSGAVEAQIIDNGTEGPPSRSFLVVDQDDDGDIDGNDPHVEVTGFSGTLEAADLDKSATGGGGAGVDGGVDVVAGNLDALDGSEFGSNGITVFDWDGSDTNQADNAADIVRLTSSVGTGTNWSNAVSSLGGNGITYGGSGGDVLVAFGDGNGNTQIGAVDTASDASNEIQGSDTYTELFEITGQSVDDFGAGDLGTAADNTLVGSSNADTVTAGSGAQTLNGAGGGDDLSGGTGKDTVNGGGEGDTLTGGADGDTLTGGSGSDRFVYGGQDDSSPSGSSDIAGVDEITDFDATDDAEVIDLSGVNLSGTNPEMTNVFDDGISNTVDESTLANDINAIVTFLGENQTHISVFTVDSGDVAQETYAAVDVDGDGTFDASPDMLIQVTGTNPSDFSTDDFVF